MSVREFKGKVLVDLREHYTDQGGDMKPGRKGAVIDDVFKIVVMVFGEYMGQIKLASLLECLANIL